MLRRFLSLLVVSVLTVQAAAADFAVGDKVRTERPVTGEGIVQEVQANDRFLVRFTSGRLAGKTLPIPKSHLELVEAVTRPAPDADERADDNPFEPKPKPPALREWSDATGQFKVQAKLIRFEDNKVTLERKDGRQVTVPAERLSQADQAFLRGDTPAPSGEPVVSSPVQAAPGDGPPLAKADATAWQAGHDTGSAPLRARQDVQISSSNLIAPKFIVPFAGPAVVAMGGHPPDSDYSACFPISGSIMHQSQSHR